MFDGGRWDGVIFRKFSFVVMQSSPLDEEVVCGEDEKDGNERCYDGLEGNFRRWEIPYVVVKDWDCYLFHYCDVVMMNSVCPGYFSFSL